MSAYRLSHSIALASRLWVGAVMAYAGFQKLMEPVANFQYALEQYPLIPPDFLPLLARTLPWVEWIGGCFLILGYLTRVCALVFLLLSLAFIAVLSVPFWTGSAGKNCGCFGQGNMALTVGQVYFLDWTNFILSFFIACRKKYILTLDGLFR